MRGIAVFSLCAVLCETGVKRGALVKSQPFGASGACAVMQGFHTVVLRSKLFRRWALSDPKIDNTKMEAIKISGVPSKKCPATDAKRIEPKVATALVTLAAVPAICPSGSIAKAVRLPNVIPA